MYVIYNYMLQNRREKEKNVIFKIGVVCAVNRILRQKNSIVYTVVNSKYSC